jgi:hypothetical protein
MIAVPPGRVNRGRGDIKNVRAPSRAISARPERSETILGRGLSR